MSTARRPMEDIFRMTKPQWFCVGDVWRHKKTGVERHILEGDCFPAWIVAVRSGPDGCWDRRYMQPKTATNGKWELISRTAEMRAATHQNSLTAPNPAMPTPTQPLECPGALSDLILQAARQALPANPQQLIQLPDCGERNQPLMPLLVGLIDAANVTAAAVADNAWDAGQPPPADLIAGLITDLEQCVSALRRSQDVF